jgi:hypothetical protein
MSSHTVRQIEAAFEMLAARVDLEGFAFDEDGEATLAFDDVAVVFRISQQEGAVLLLAPLGQPANPSEALFSALLEANFGWAGTGGGTISREPGDGPLMLMRRLSGEGMTADSLEADLGAFVSAAESLAKHIAASMPDEPETDFAVDPTAIRI